MPMKTRISHTTVHALQAEVSTILQSPPKDIEFICFIVRHNGGLSPNRRKTPPDHLLPSVVLAKTGQPRHASGEVKIHIECDADGARVRYQKIKQARESAFHLVHGKTLGKGMQHAGISSRTWMRFKFAWHLTPSPEVCEFPS